MSKDSTDYSNLLSAFSNDGLQLLTPAEMEEFRKLTADLPEPDYETQVAAWQAIPMSIRLSLLELIRGATPDDEPGPERDLPEEKLWGIALTGVTSDQLARLPQAEFIAPSLRCGRWLGSLPDPPDEDDVNWLRHAKLSPDDKLWARQQQQLEEERKRAESPAKTATPEPAKIEQPTPAREPAKPKEPAVVPAIPGLTRKPVPESVAKMRRDAEAASAFGVPAWKWKQIRL